jgi:hypothetical protein
MAIIYQHTQVGRWILAVAVPAMLAAAAMAFRDSFAGGLIVSILATFALLSFFTLTTAVSDDEVRVWFGIGLIRRRITLTRIASVRAVRSHWIHGWGIRLIPNGWLWNVSGLGGVELSLVNGRSFRIGTDEPERLEAAIQGALRKRKSKSTSRAIRLS